MTSAACDCLCAGIIVADHVCAPIDHMPAPGELVLSPRTELTIGGCASNVAVDLAKLGRHSALLGRVGRDVSGRTVREALEATGVDCGNLVESDTAQTSESFVINVRGEDRRFIHTPGANAEFTGIEMTAERIRSARVLYLGGYCLSDTLTAENVAAAFRIAREAGVTTVLDVVLPKPGDYWPQLRPVLPWTDVFLPNDDEATIITGLKDPFAQADEFYRAGVKTAVVTCGGRGAVLVGDGQRLHSAGYRVEYVDGTGSGDAFVAGYIHGLLAGREAADCLRWGSALGASCVRATGATTGIFNATELADYLAANPLEVTSL